MWIIIFLNHSHIFNFVNGTNDAHAQERIFWIINEILRIHHTFCDVDDAHSYEFTVDPVIVMVATWSWVDCFIFVRSEVVHLFEIIGSRPFFNTFIVFILFVINRARTHKTLQLIGISVLFMHSFFIFLVDFKQFFSKHGSMELNRVVMLWLSYWYVRNMWIEICLESFVLWVARCFPSFKNSLFWLLLLFYAFLILIFAFAAWSSAGESSDSVIRDLNINVDKLFHIDYFNFANVFLKIIWGLL